MFFNNGLERPDAFLDEGIMFKVLPNPGLNLTHLRTAGPRAPGLYSWFARDVTIILNLKLWLLYGLELCCIRILRKFGLKTVFCLRVLKV